MTSYETTWVRGCPRICGHLNTGAGSLEARAAYPRPTSPLQSSINQRELTISDVKHSGRALGCVAGGGTGVWACTRFSVAPQRGSNMIQQLTLACGLKKVWATLKSLYILIYPYISLCPGTSQRISTHISATGTHTEKQPAQ